MKKLFLVLLTALSLSAAENPKVVIDLTTGDMHTFEQKILKGIVAHKTYFENQLKELDVAVVIHGNAYKFFLKEPAHFDFAKDPELLKAAPELAKRIAALAETYDVTFLMCQAGMTKKKIDARDVYPGIATVLNAGVGLIEKQNEGYAYLPVGD
ncbi:DsrE family protein [Sulfurimonas sp. HSL-1656]|uniref:DsrE family protein n=1 Tax=Thiomicrolovo subterrani TaxID=3131934 RepID=UPI0031F7C36B